MEARCGEFFGYDTITGTDLKRISFNYEMNDKTLFRAVAYSTIKTHFDASKSSPTVQYTGTGDIIVRISERVYEREKNCLPPPETPDPVTP